MREASYATLQEVTRPTCPPPPNRESNTMSSLSDFEQHCIEPCLSDPWFNNPSNLSTYSNLGCDSGLFYHQGCLLVPVVEVCIKNALLMHILLFMLAMAFLLRLRDCSLDTIGGQRLTVTIKDFIKHFVSCQVKKPTDQKPAGLLMPLQIPARLCATVSMDLITFLPKAGSGLTAILVFDRMSKMSYFVVTKTELTAVDCATYLGIM